MNCIFQQRNKPKEPPKARKAAPFFLPTIAGLEPKFAIENNEQESEKVIYSNKYFILLYRSVITSLLILFKFFFLYLYNGQ